MSVVAMVLASSGLDRHQLAIGAAEDADLSAVGLNQPHLALREVGEGADVDGVARALRHVIPTSALGFYRSPRPPVPAGDLPGYPEAEPPRDRRHRRAHRVRPA